MISSWRALPLAGCAVFAGLIFLEVHSSGGDDPAVEPAPPQAATKAAPARAHEREPRVEDLVAAARARPLFSPARRPPDSGASADDAERDLPDVRLTGIVIEPDRRIAIFAVPGAKPLVRSEGEALKAWRLDSIAPEAVSLSGPGGTRTLTPKADSNLVRRPPLPPAAPGQPQPAPQAGRPAAGASGQPAAAVPRPAPAPPQASLPKPRPRRPAHDQ